MEVKLTSGMQLRVESKTRSLAGICTAEAMCSCDMGPCVRKQAVVLCWVGSPVLHSS